LSLTCYNYGDKSQQEDGLEATVVYLELRKEQYCVTITVLIVTAFKFKFRGV